MEKGKEEKRKVLEVMRDVLENGDVGDEPEKKIIARELVENEILFFDPVERRLRFQTKLDERAAGKILEMG